MISPTLNLIKRSLYPLHQHLYLSFSLYRPTHREHNTTIEKRSKSLGSTTTITTPPLISTPLPGPLCPAPRRGYYMGKSPQIATKFQKLSMSRAVLSADQISRLPDDILVNILSRLTMKEAARTTILSNKWKNLWTHTTGSLDFDGSNILCNIKMSAVLDGIDPPVPVQERPVFVSWVNKILKSHKGAPIDEFRVHFDLDSSSRSDIDSWINFALRKRSRTLELDLERVNRYWKDPYPFPAQSLIDHPTINSLTHLKLSYVDVTRELLEYVLSNCPFLEFVCIKCSRSLVGAKVVASPKLRYLEIFICKNVEILEISSAINLRTLKFTGLKPRLCFKNAPNLTDVTFGGIYASDIVNQFRMHSIPPSQIEKLKLDWAFFRMPSFNGFPELKNLKQLELVVTGGGPSSLLYYATLLEKCPMLYRLCVQFKWINSADWLRGPEGILMHDIELTLKSLKFVEISGFRASIGFGGSICDVDLATFLVTKAPYLEKMIIDTRTPPFYSGTPLEVLQKENMAAKERARQLSTKLSPLVTFLIL